MPEPLAPQDIARRTFDVARRGYEQQQVRGFLHEVSAVIDRLARAEQELRERAERAEARLEMADKPDEATLLEALGEETTSVLTSARTAAQEIRTKAEESAARMIAEATAEATETRRSAVDDAATAMAEAREERDGILETARAELARRTEEAEAAAARVSQEAETEVAAKRAEGAAALEQARAEAEVILEEARQQGRVMVAEAQAVRERILRDLAVRRKRARQQVEKLNAGRERLLSAYDVVRRTVDEATNELAVALTDARVAADAASRRIDDEPEPTLEQLDAEVSTAGLVDLPIADVDHHDDDAPGPFSGEVPAVDTEASSTAAAGGPDSAATIAPAPAERTAAGAPPAVEEHRSPIVLDERRGRKGRRRKGFEGLPPAELSVVEPAIEGEGVRILAEPAVGSDEPTSSDDVGAAESSEPAAPAADAAAADALVADVAGEPIATESSDGAPPVDIAADPGPAADEPGVMELGASTESVVESAPAAVSESPSAEVPGAPTAPSEVPGAPTAPSAEVPGAPTAPSPDSPAAGTAPGPGDDARPGATTAAAQVFARLRAGQDEVAPTVGAPLGDEGAGVAEAAPADAEPVAPTTAHPDAGTVDAESSAPAEPAPAEVAPEPTVPPAFAARRAALDPLERELSRRLKRSLADEQNEVLDLLRRAKPKGTADLFPSADEHAARWADAAGLVLTSAARAGAASLGGTEASSTDDLAAELAAALTAPLRERMDRSFTASDGNLDDVADRMRALYREWKGQRLAEAVQHHVAAAYARGVLDAVDEGTLVQWVVDPSVGPCPDCDDNVLAGHLVKGEAFPTGNPCAPAHPGCHCLVLPAG